MFKSAVGAAVLGLGVLALVPASSQAAAYTQATIGMREALAGATSYVEPAVVVRRRVLRGPAVVVRPFRPWVHRPHYGRVIAGIVLGTIIVATAVAVAPKPPAPDLCWYWSDRGKTKGYWDYC